MSLAKGEEGQHQMKEPRSEYFSCLHIHMHLCAHVCISRFKVQSVSLIYVLNNQTTSSHGLQVKWCWFQKWSKESKPFNSPIHLESYFIICSVFYYCCLPYCTIYIWI